MVIAGPGAGKTTTAVTLVDAVLDRVDEESTVLFVSFSNAAIDAALASMNDLDERRSERVMAMTLDSLAAQLVDDELTSSSQPNFTDRLNRARAHVVASGGDELSAIAHLVVDEAQDLTAERRAFLLAIIEFLPAGSGFTIFGDPWQAIYSFDDTDGSGEAWQALFEALTIDGAPLPMLVLDGEYRARSSQSRRIANSLAAIRDRSTERSSVVDHLEEALIHATDTDLDRLHGKLFGWKGSTAILAWRNSEVLDLVDALRRQQVRCDRIEPLASSSTPRVAPWVAEIFAATGGSPFDMVDFDEFSRSHPEVHYEWFRALAHAVESSSPQLAWPAIARMIQRDRSLDKPWHLLPSRICVSTIHQSKGREFDNVVIGNPDGLLRPSSGDPQLELLYVALTRAHDRVFTLNWNAPWSETVPGTCTRIRKPPGRRRPTALSVVSSDVRRTRAVGGRRGQEALAVAHPGDPVRFERLNSTKIPVYRLLLNGEAVGVTTEQFGSVVKRVCGDRWPELGPIPLEGIETSVYTGIGVDFSLQPRVAGFSNLTF